MVAVHIAVADDVLVVNNFALSFPTLCLGRESGIHCNIHS